ncbi:MAG: alcohol dehydrogenase catalytic domain-containing protein, partial [Pseudomonadota bacterium]
MTQTTLAFQIDRDGKTHQAGLKELPVPELDDGEVRIAVEYSSVNYKDALAGAGKGAILRRFPLVGGIDLAGHVAVSRHSDFQEGDAVLATGCG